MTKILFKYLVFGYFKTIFKVVLIFYCFGIVLNLFEEIEFFKNIDTSIITPITLTALYIPNMIIKLFPFIIFIACMWNLLFLRNSSDLLTLKVFGYSNFKIFFILAFTSFILGWLILFTINPITSVMVKYYEQTKSEYSRDLDHLVSINKNGLWIKENVVSGYRIISADETRDNILKNVIIYNLDANYNLLEKISSKTADILKNNWILNEVNIDSFNNGISVRNSIDQYEIVSTYNFDKISSLYKNFDTMSFLDLIMNYQELQNKGYIKSYLDQNLNSMLSMPFFLFIMTALASMLTLNTLKKSNNFMFIITGLIACVIIYYFKDLSLALGQTNRISMSLASWIPVVTIGLFSTIGILQINEK
ncbi:MAG: lipopolysaccharide export system permease protein [Pelagibacterales bacterium]|nr:lipopolysaccharide export system permease protein [Pelagibacterales bacterium]